MRRRLGLSFMMMTEERQADDDGYIRYQMSAEERRKHTPTRWTLRIGLMERGLPGKRVHRETATRSDTNSW